MKNKYYTSRDPIKNYFPLPNEVFALGLSPGALAVYSYLMYIEDRTTYQCHASYKTIAKAVNMSPNTVRKYVTELVERGLIQTEHTSIITQDGRKQNGSLLYTLLPIQFSIQQFYEQKLAKLDAECEQERIRKRLEAFQQVQQKNACPPGCVRFSGHSRAAYSPEAQNRTLRRCAGALRKAPSAERTAERKAALRQAQARCPKRQNRAILDAAAERQEKSLALFCASTSTSARSAGSFGG